ncbi:MAG: hypothetical protein ACHQ0J_10370 [Candidatus Dormibacterales bacterium]
MQSTPEPGGAPDRDRPASRWVGWILVVGALGLLVWAWFLLGFRSEPSATGRSRLVLLAYVAYTAVSALSGLAAAFGVARGARGSRRWAAVAAVAMSLTCVGAIAGVPVLVSVVPSPRSPSPRSPSN